ncbi:MAG: ribonuclease E/G [Rhodospirillales bacterium]
MTISSIVVSGTPEAARAAFLDASSLVGFAVGGAGDGARIGDIYLGRVARVVSPLAAAFVDVGLERDGWLALPVRGKGRVIGEGDAVLVQIRRELEPGKGVRLTANPTLPGRTLVLVPGGNRARLSPRLAAAADRRRLESLAGTLPAGTGWVVRTAAGGVEAEEIAAEAARLLVSWGSITAAAAEARPPARLHRAADPLIAAIDGASGPELTAVVVDHPRTMASIRRALPHVAARLRLHRGSRPVFEDWGVDEQLEAALAPRIVLPVGGTVTFAETAAVVAIDVDVGAADRGDRDQTILRVNLEAAAAIARQVRLRDLGGHIVVDFVPMKRRDHATRVLDALRSGFADDRGEPQFAGFTRLGLVEMTRRRRGPSLARRLGTHCPLCGAHHRSHDDGAAA